MVVSQLNRQAGWVLQIVHLELHRARHYECRKAGSRNRADDVACRPPGHHNAPFLAPEPGGHILDGPGPACRLAGSVDTQQKGEYQHGRAKAQEYIGQHCKEQPDADYQARAELVGQKTVVKLTHRVEEAVAEQEHREIVFREPKISVEQGHRNTEILTAQVEPCVCQP